MIKYEITYVEEINRRTVRKPLTMIAESLVALYKLLEDLPNIKRIVNIKEVN